MVSWQLFPQRDKSPEFFFSKKEKEHIKAVISKIEKKTSAELRVHVERRNHDLKMMEQASLVFEKLGMTQTHERSGVLIFICSDSNEFAILGDVGIHKKVPEQFWSESSEKLQNCFEGGKFSQGVEEALENIGIYLKKYFPAPENNANQLSDEVSFG